MLLELHVKNMALIERADLELGRGLTVLSGETGAGKSILIDSINYALGAKAGKSVIRNGAESAYIELVFDGPAAAAGGAGRISSGKTSGTDGREVQPEENLREEEIPDDVLVVSRKISQNRSIARVNEETVTQAGLREITRGLIDMHGQFEHQSLLSAASHLNYIDKLSGERSRELRGELAQIYGEYAEAEEQLSAGIDKAMREREADILRYEIEEIENAQLRSGEEESLLDEFRKMKNASRISSALALALDRLEGQSDAMTHAIRAVSDAASYDRGLEEFRKQLSEIDELGSEALRGISDYMESLNFDSSRFDEVENRLEVIHRLQGKYGDDIEGIFEQLENKKERLDFLDHYDNTRADLLKQKKMLGEKMDALSTELSEIRKKTARELEKQIKKELEDLNFLGVEFGIEIRSLEKYSANGRDAAQFLISTNPGQPMKPLKEVASGGELSRIMLALKTVLADTDEIETLIFDEIDAGISGVTAQKVAEKLKRIGARHQVLCITHLPQIAAMADHNILIRKSTDGLSTRTEISYITGEEIRKEIERLIGGAEIIEKYLDDSFRSSSVH